MIQIKLKNRTFKSKKDYHAWVKEMITKSRESIAYTTDEHEDLIAMASMHPRVGPKIRKCNKKYLRIICSVPVGFGEQSRGFVCVINEKEDRFTYRLCNPIKKSPDTKWNDFTHTCRILVMDQIRQFKKENNMTENDHVHHDEISFDKLLRHFVKWWRDHRNFHFRITDLIQLKGKEEFTSKFDNEEFNKTWQAFHKKHAILKCLSEEEHRKLHHG